MTRYLQSGCHSAGIVRQECVSAPIISSEGLLRLAGLVARVRSRDRDEGGVSWTAHIRTSSPEVQADTDPAGGVVGGVAGGEAAGGRADPEHAAGAGGGGSDERR